MKKRIFLTVLVLLALAVVVSAQNGEPEFRIGRLVMATEIQDREPVGEATVFSGDTERIFCFLEAENILQDTFVTFAWIYEGEEIHRIDLPLSAGSRWRTRAEKSLYGLTGQWRVEIRDAAGNVMDTVAFRVE